MYSVANVTVRTAGDTEYTADWLLEYKERMASMSVSQKYGVLRVIATILKFLAWLVLAAGIIGMIIVLANTGKMPEALRPLAAAGTFAVPILAIVWFLQLFGFGSILSLLIDIEENTRGMAARPPD